MKSCNDCYFHVAINLPIVEENKENKACWILGGWEKMTKQKQKEEHILIFM